MKMVFHELFVFYLHVRLWLAIAYVYLAPLIYFFTHRTVTIAPGVTSIVDRKIPDARAAAEIARYTPAELEAMIGGTIRLDAL